MPFLLFFIVISFAFYLFYKTKYIRSRRPVEKKWLATKSSISLGLFVCLFGINQLFLFQSTVTYIVSSIFILIGGYNVYGGIKSYHYYLPYASKEAEERLQN